MLLLALEFSSARRSVALFQRAEGNEPGQVLGEVTEGGVTPARPLTLVDAVLTQAGVERAAVQGLVVGLGPGSYTGIRSAIALAQGWQLARGIQLAGVSTAECLAMQARAQGWFGDVSIAIDAQRNEFYLATYQISADSCAVREPLQLVPAAEVTIRANLPDTLLVGPDVARLSPNARVLFPQAQDLPRCNPLKLRGFSAQGLEPIYLRPVSFVKAPPPRVLPR